MCAKFFKPRKARWLFQLTQLRKPGRHRQRIPGKRAGLVHRPERRKKIHHIGTTAKSPHRQTTTNHFAETTKIRHNPLNPLHAGFTQSEAGHDLVEDQQGTKFFGDR